VIFVKMRNLIISITTLVFVLTGELALGTWFPIPINASGSTIENITILVNKKLYNDYKHPFKPVGELTAYQGLTVVDVDKDWSPLQSIVPKWYLVKTWLGNKWIQANDSVVRGSYIDERRELTTVFEVTLFDRPDFQYQTNLKISPQKLKSTAYIDYAPLTFSSATSLTYSSGRFYQIKTWLGDKWIYDPAVLENVKEEHSDLELNLMDGENVYPTPFRIDSAAERIGAQKVKAIAQWDDRRGPEGYLWYKIQLPQGDRWVTLAQ
jgi:hypothetical protein